MSDVILELLIRLAPPVTPITNNPKIIITMDSSIKEKAERSVVFTLFRHLPKKVCLDDEWDSSPRERERERERESWLRPVFRFYNFRYFPQPCP
jgi:hypothetical protein